MSTKRLYTLVFIKQNNKLLLGYKVRGFGKGLWNGFGGKLESNETLLEGAERELFEECSLRGKLRHLGIVYYDIIDEDFDQIVHIFDCTEFTGIESPSEEMNPIKWFPYEDIPFNKMWPDAVEWYPLMLKGKHFWATITYENDKIQKSQIEECDDLNNKLKNFK